jgi:tungstate transport system substrate-binding protein
MSKTKDADVVLAHDKPNEQKYVRDGFLKNRKDVMYNDFIIVGPTADPAAVALATSAADSMKRIGTKGAAGQAIWASRGDNSGTHNKEKYLWSISGYTPIPAVPFPAWYKSLNSGMGETLVFAGEAGAYTLADRATWLVRKPGNLKILHDGDANLYNQYGVLETVGARRPEAAKNFSDWITSPAGQNVIYNFGRAKYGISLFIPNAN